MSTDQHPDELQPRRDPAPGMRRLPMELHAQLQAGRMRNEFCPCGSGYKTKRCHGAPDAALLETARVAMAAAAAKVGL